MAALLLPAVTNALVGGEPAAEGQFPGVVLVAAGENNFCTAYKIGPRQFLFAGHCVTERRKTLKKTFDYGRTKDEFRTGGKLYLHYHAEKAPETPWDLLLTIENTRVHFTHVYADPEDALTKTHMAFDAALVTVVEETAGIPTGKIAKVPEDGEVIKLGYGCTSKEEAAVAECTSGKQPRKLHYARAKLKETGEYHHQTSTDVALGYYDSGGPLMTDEGTIGVNSTTLLDEAVDLHTRLDLLGGWIDGDDNGLFHRVIDPKNPPVLDRRGRPDWLVIRRFLRPPAGTPIKAKLSENCPLKISALTPRESQGQIDAVHTQFEADTGTAAYCRLWIERLPK